MGRAAFLLVLSWSLRSLAFAAGPCPVTLLSATADRSSIAITFRNDGKLPIRQLEFNCVLVRQHASKRQSVGCREQNALFFPGTEYSVSYAYPEGVPLSCDTSSWGQSRIAAKPPADITSGRVPAARA